jgi:hypothetical protein
MQLLRRRRTRIRAKGKSRVTRIPRKIRRKCLHSEVAEPTLAAIAMPHELKIIGPIERHHFHQIGPLAA